MLKVICILALVLLYYPLGWVGKKKERKRKKTSATFSNKSKLGVSYMYLHRVPIGSLRCLRLLCQSGHFGFSFTTLCENLAISLLLGWNCYSMHTRLFRCECKEQGLPIFENIAYVCPFAEILMTIKPDCRFKYCNSKNSFSTAATKSNWFSSGKSEKYQVAYLIFGPKRGGLIREGGLIEKGGGAYSKSQYFPRNSQ